MLIGGQTITGCLPSGNLTLLWKIIILNGKTHYKWQFSIAMLNYQRVQYMMTCLTSTIVHMIHSYLRVHIYIYDLQQYIYIYIII